MYYITTFCYGNKYEPIIPKWKQRIQQKCKDAQIIIHNTCNIQLQNGFQYGWWDIVRLYNNLSILQRENTPVVHVDVDIIIEKDIRPLVDLNYDIIISREIGKEKAFPPECSRKIGFGVCTGFYIIKPPAIKFLSHIFNLMQSNVYNSSSDQVNIMNYITSYPDVKIQDEEILIENIPTYNKIITIDGIKICVLDFDTVTRDPIYTKNQYANHINIDNVGGTYNFLQYFDKPLEELPLTCRCGKAHLGDNSICTHIRPNGKN